MTMLNKILLALLGITIISAIIFVVYKTNQLTKQQEDIKNSLIEQKQLAEQIVRAQSQYVNQADFNKFANQHNIDIQDIQKDLNNLGGKIDGLNNFTVSSNVQTGTGIGSTSTTPNPKVITIPTVECNGEAVSCPMPDPFGYNRNIQNLQLSEQFKDLQVPFGSVSFDASQEKPWGYNIPERKYNVNTVIGHTADGQTVVYNQLQITAGTDKKEYKIPIENSNFVENFPAPTMSWWNPRLYLGISGSIGISRVPIKGEASPTLSLGIMSYGKTKQNPDLSIIQVGAGYNIVSQKASVELSPIQYNIGQHFKSGIISNLYIGPTISADLGGSVYLGGGIRVGL